jgi:arsenate reductase
LTGRPITHAELSPVLRQCLRASVACLAGEFAGVFSRETVARYVEESYQQVGRRPTVGPNFLPVIIERFAREWLWAAAQSQGRVEQALPEVLFVCEHNAGRSQMAAALAQHLSNGWVGVRSAGSHPDEQIDPAVVEAMAELGVDVAHEFPKPLTDEVVGAADVVVTLGCGDACPVNPGRRYLDWPVADPAGQPLEVVRAIRYELYHRVWELLETLVPADSLTAINQPPGGQR